MPTAYKFTAFFQYVTILLTVFMYYLHITYAFYIIILILPKFFRSLRKTTIHIRAIRAK